MPAYVVFTDATLTAIAERKPSDIAALATISGVGAAKLARFGESVLSILGGADPVEVAQNASAAGEIRGARHALTTRPSNFYVNYVAHSVGAALA